MKNNAVTAAQILVTVKTGLGKVVPDYAKKIVASNNAEGANAIRVVRETRDLLAQMRSTTREKIFDQNSEIRDWYYENQESEEVADLA